MRFATAIVAVFLLTVVLEVTRAHWAARGQIADPLFGFLRASIIAAAVIFVLWGQRRAQSARVDWPKDIAAAPEVAYCLGPQPPTFTARAHLGRLHLGADTLRVEGSPAVSIPLASLRAVGFEPVHGARLLRVEHGVGTLFVLPIRASFLGGWGLLSHRPLSAALHRELLAHLQPTSLQA